MRFFDFFKRLFNRPDGEKADSAWLDMLGMLAITDENEIDCDRVYALLDQFAEMAARGEDVSRLMPLVQKHLDLCPDCREEYQTLLNILRTAGNAAGA